MKSITNLAFTINFRNSIVCDTMKNVFCKEIAEFECKDCGKYFCEPCCQYHSDNSKCHHISNNTMVDESCLNTDKVADSNAIPAITSDSESSNNSNQDLQVEMIDLTNIDNW